jgi:predicted ArsR family transcriptional regulator
MTSKGSGPRSRGSEAGLAPDAFSADEFSAAVSAVTSAFGDATRRDIYLFLRESDEGATATEVAEAFSLHANVARHHLDKLAAGGYVVVDLARHESAGRPSKRYRAAEHDSSLTFPPRRDALIGTLLARAIERLDDDEARAMAEDVGFEYGQWLAGQMSPTEGQRSQKAALAAVADALTAHGFAAHAEAAGKGLTIVNEHCAFGAAAQQYPHVLCAVDRGMIRGMLAGLYGDCDPQFVERRPEGADHCVAHVSPA